MSQIWNNVLLKEQNEICISIKVVARSWRSLDLRKERLCLIRTVEKLNVCLCGKLLMKDGNSLDPLFTNSRESVLEEPTCQLYDGQWPMTKPGTGGKGLTLLRKRQSSQVKRPKFSAYPLWHGWLWRNNHWTSYYMSLLSITCDVQIKMLIC